MTFIKHNEVPKIIRDILAQIMDHPELDEFMIDPAEITSESFFKNSGHPWWQEKYMCLMDNPVLYNKREKEFEAALAAAKNNKEAAAIPDFTDTASKELRDLVGKLQRYLEWWLSDEDRRDDHYVNLQRVAAFNRTYPDLLLMPATPLNNDEVWYSDSEDHYPIIRTPRGLITSNTDSIFNSVQLGNTDWNA